MKWHEVCLSISAAILEILNAWENGVLTFESIQVGLVGGRAGAVLCPEQGPRLQKLWGTLFSCSDRSGSALELAVTWEWDTDVAPAPYSCSSLPRGWQWDRQGQCHPCRREGFGPAALGGDGCTSTWLCSPSAGSAPVENHGQHQGQGVQHGRVCRGLAGGPCPHAGPG